MEQKKKGDGVHQYRVTVYLYDLSQGMAKTFSPMLLGKTIEGIWHSGLVVYDHEYYYGGGIQSSAPGKTMAGQPMRQIEIGWTSKTQKEFHSFLRSISHKFTQNTYSLLSNNCNNFADAAAHFLLGKGIPSYITGLPEEALNTGLGQMLRPVIQQFENQMKQSTGRGGGGLVPWSEGSGGGSYLFLPPDRGPNRIKDKRWVTARELEQQHKTTRSTTSDNKSNASESTQILEPLPVRYMHPHETLVLQRVGRPPASGGNTATPPDNPLQLAFSFAPLSRHSSLCACIKSLNARVKKHDAQLALSSDELAVIKQLGVRFGKVAGQPFRVDDGQSWLFSDSEEKDESFGMPKDFLAMWDRLLQWPGKQVFAPLGLLRLLLTRADFADAVVRQIAEHHKDKQKGPDLIDRINTVLEDASFPETTRYIACMCLSHLITHLGCYGADASQFTPTKASAGQSKNTESKKSQSGELAKEYPFVASGGAFVAKHPKLFAAATDVLGRAVNVEVLTTISSETKQQSEEKSSDKRNLDAKTQKLLLFCAGVMSNAALVLPKDENDTTLNLAQDLLAVLNSEAVACPQKGHGLGLLSSVRLLQALGEAAFCNAAVTLLSGVDESFLERLSVLDQIFSESKNASVRGNGAQLLADIKQLHLSVLEELD